LRFYNHSKNEFLGKVAHALAQQNLITAQELAN